jgi:hypothetical protein
LLSPFYETAVTGGLMMKTAKWSAGVAAAVLSWLVPVAVAQVPGRPSPSAIIAESPLKGVVVSATPVSLTVNGEVKVVPRRMHGLNSVKDEPKVERQDVQFAIKDAKVTRDGKSCEPKDIRRGDTATVEFTSPKPGSTKFIATQVDVTSKGSGASK